MRAGASADVPADAQMTTRTDPSSRTPSAAANSSVAPSAIRNSEPRRPAHPATSAYECPSRASAFPLAAAMSVSRASAMLCACCSCSWAPRTLLDPPVEAARRCTSRDAAAWVASAARTGSSEILAAASAERSSASCDGACYVSDVVVVSRTLALTASVWAWRSLECRDAASLRDCTCAISRKRHVFLDISPRSSSTQSDAAVRAVAASCSPRVARQGDFFHWIHGTNAPQPGSRSELSRRQRASLPAEFPANTWRPPATPAPRGAPMTRA